MNRILLLIPCHSLEDFPVELEEQEAASLLNAWSIAFLPALLYQAESFPQWSRADSPPEPEPGDFVIASSMANSWIPHDYFSQLEDAGGKFFEASENRSADLQTLQQEWELPATDPSDAPRAEELAKAFLAFGTVWLIGEILARQMRHFQLIEETTAQQSILQAAQSWKQGDWVAVESQLSDAYGQLQEKREQFYPIDPLFVDHVLVEEGTSWDDLLKLAESPLPVSLQMTGEALESLWGNATEEQQNRFLTLMNQQPHCIVGGMQSEAVNQLQDLSVLQEQIQQNHETFTARGLTPPTVWASRTFGLCSQLPQVLNDHDFQAALHNAIDDGLFPADEQSHYRWEARDGSGVSANSRLPLPGQTAAGLLQLPQQISDGMDHDQIAMVSWMRLPNAESPWLDDLKVASQYPCVLGKFVHWNEFFEQTEDNGHPNQSYPFEYRSSWLAQAVGKRQTNPISYWQQELLSQRQTKANQLLSETIKLFRSGTEASDDQAVLEQVAQLAGRNTQDSASKGTLLINRTSHSQSSRVVFKHPVEKSEGLEYIASNESSSDVCSALVTVPGNGFRWIPASKALKENRSRKSPPLAEEWLLRNDYFTVSINPQTGGIEQVKTYDRSPNRFSQQLAFHFNKVRHQVIEEQTGKTKKVHYSLMRAKSLKIVECNAAVGAIASEGMLFDPETHNPVAEFQQTVQVCRGERTLRISIDITPKESCGPYPWNSYFCSRFAWNDPQANLTGAIQQGTTDLHGEQFESIDFVRWGASGHTASLYAEGRPFYRISEPRKLDALMMVRDEQTKHFEYVVSIDEPTPMKTFAALATPMLTSAPMPQPKRTSGWFWHVNSSNVQLMKFTAHDPEVPNSSLIELLETDGFHRHITLTCPKPVQKASQVNAKNRQTGELSAEGRKVKVEVNQYEHVRIRLFWE